MDPTFKLLFDESEREIYEILSEAGVDAEEVRILAAKALDLSSKILVDGMSGKDVTIAKQALAGIKANIASSASNTVAKSITSVLETTILKFGSLVAQIIIAL